MRPDVSDLLILVGVGACVAGAWLIYPPAALILLGTALVVAGVRAAGR